MPVIVEGLSPILRAKFRDAIKKTDLFNCVAAKVWQKDGVVHCKLVATATLISGKQSVCRHLILSIFCSDPYLLKEATEMLRSFSAEIIAGATINTRKGHRMICHK